MILNPPRSAAELSPRLRAISELALDQFVEPEPRRRVSWGIVRRVFLLVVLLVGTYATHLALNSWEAKLLTPTDYAVQAENFRAMARQCENLAIEYRKLAANGQASSAKVGTVPTSPRMLMQMAAMSDRRAASFRNLANVEERKNQGLPVP